jgi:DNA-binding response OmpR family regulator
MSEVPKHILCIDDERETAALLAEDLAERGFRVSLAHSAQAGLSIILRSAPDLVLSDITMPGMSGFDLLSHVTAQWPRLPAMPFIFLTAMADREHELRGRQLGADDYVTKPVDFDMLHAIISARLAGVARARVWPQQVGLNARETETLTWAARGKTSAEIASIIGLAKRTVDFHIDNARNKLDASTRVHAVVKAAAGGLIPL